MRAGRRWRCGVEVPARSWRMRRISVRRALVLLALPLVAYTIVRVFTWPVAPLISILWLIAIGASEWSRTRARG